MHNDLHSFHIPVMGTSFSADSPIRLAPFGISSVISIVDDRLLEKLRCWYCREYNIPYRKIAAGEEDARARRITAYLNMTGRIVELEMERIRQQPFFEDNKKRRYFELLPETSPLKQRYLQLPETPPGTQRTCLENELNQRMQPGSIDVNIMVKLDLPRFDKSGKPLGDEFSDARSALRGYAESRLQTPSAIVFSAGINQGLFRYMSRFRDFYRDAAGKINKQIIIKVSDFRSAMIQGRFLARMGLEVSEFRIESGLNCGGHAFPAGGKLLPELLQEFKEQRDALANEFRPAVLSYYQKQGWVYPEAALQERPLITVQGGIGIHGEDVRLRRDFGMDRTGWGSPFLLVPEATRVDETSRELMRRSGPEAFYLSAASPLGVPFNNIRHSGSERWTRQKFESGHPGSPCPRGLLAFDTEFTEAPICTASTRYQQLKLKQIHDMDIPEFEKQRLRQDVEAKVCLCNHLGNPALIELGISREETSPQALCPGQNLAWFDRFYSLSDMLDHIYGRGESLVPAERPHMFAQEIVMNVDYFQKLAENCSGRLKEIKRLREFKENMESGMRLCLKIAETCPCRDENLASIVSCVREQGPRIESILRNAEKKAVLGNSNPVKESPLPNDRAPKVKEYAGRLPHNAGPPLRGLRNENS